MSDGDVLLIPTDPDTPYPLGRAGVNHDPRNRLFRAMELEPRETRPRTRPWYSTWVSDQGQTSECTAHAAVGMLRTQPHTVPFRAHRPYYDEPGELTALYREAQRHDPWEGEAYEGSSGDAPLRVLRQRGQIAEWRWLFGLAEVRHFLQFTGPVSVGTWWYDSMFYPDRGFISISPDAARSGGHQWRILYYDEPRQRYRMVNSWGRPWGQWGRAWVSEATLERLLDEQGDAVTVVNR